MTVYFIGAGPGAADLITVRGQRLLSRCPVCLYAGSIMPEDLLALCPPDARVIDTGPLTLDQIITELADAHAAGLDVARLHSGDPSIYSALAEQCRRLDALGVDYEIVPGVPAFAAAAAALGRELTVPGVAQTVTLTPGGDAVDRDAAGRGPADAIGAGRHAGAAPGRRADRCDRAAAARRRLRSRNTLCRGGIRQLAAGDGAAGARWPTSPRRCRPQSVTRTAVIVVGDVLAAEGFSDSYLYSSGTARAGGGIDAGTAARRHRRGACAGRGAGTRGRRDQLAGGPRARSGAAGREVRIGGFGGVDGMRRWLVDTGGRRRRRRHPSVRRHHHRARRSGMPRAAVAAPGAGPSGLAAGRRDCRGLRRRGRGYRCTPWLFAGLPDHGPIRGRRHSPTSTPGS